MDSNFRMTMSSKWIKSSLIYCEENKKDKIILNIKAQKNIKFIKNFNHSLNCY